MKIDFYTKISPTNKFEGLTLFSKPRTNPISTLWGQQDTDVLEKYYFQTSIDLK
jgi:hypothetical protein